MDIISGHRALFSANKRTLAPGKLHFISRPLVVFECEDNDFEYHKKMGGLCKRTQKRTLMFWQQSIPDHPLPNVSLVNVQNSFVEISIFSIFLGLSKFSFSLSETRLTMMIMVILVESQFSLGLLSHLPHCECDSHWPGCTQLGCSDFEVPS